MCFSPFNVLREISRDSDSEKTPQKLQPFREGAAFGKGHHEIAAVFGEEAVVQLNKGLAKIADDSTSFKL